MIVLDSSFLVAFHNDRDVHHSSAGEAMERLIAGEWGKILLPEYVFLEVVTVLMARRDLETATAVGRTLLQAREVEFVPCYESFVDAWEEFTTQAEPRLSFADAAIVAIARRRDAKYVATFDADFHQVEGVEVVPRPASA